MTTREFVSYVSGGVIGSVGLATGWIRAVGETRKNSADAAAAKANPANVATKTAFDGLQLAVENLSGEVERMRTERRQDQIIAMQRENELHHEIYRLRREVIALRQLLARHGITPPSPEEYQLQIIPSQVTGETDGADGQAGQPGGEPEPLF